MNGLEDSIHIPWARMTEREQAYWNDMCRCDHTRLDHDVRLRGFGGKCLRCPSHGRLHRPLCRRFMFARTFTQYAKDFA